MENMDAPGIALLLPCARMVTVFNFSSKQRVTLSKYIPGIMTVDRDHFNLKCTKDGTNFTV